MNSFCKDILSPRIQPIAATDIAPAWLHQVREVIVRKALRVRPGIPACVELRAEDDERWYALQLPSNGVELVGKRDRDQVVAWLSGAEALPEIPETAPVA